jgi:hypothetical protein
MSKGGLVLGLTTLPRVLLVTSAGNNVEIYVEGDFSLTQINRLHQIAATVFVEQGYTADDANIIAQPGPNPHGQLVLGIKLSGDPRLPDLQPLAGLLKPCHTATASLAVRPHRTLLHYRLSLPTRRTVRSDQISRLKNGPKGMHVKDNVIELWHTGATTNAAIWAEAQLIAGMARCLIVGDMLRY